MSNTRNKYVSEDRVENVSDIVGSWGQWQRNIFIFFFIGAMCSCWHSLSLSFYAPDINYRCAKPDIYQNVSDNDWLNMTKGANQCKRFDNPSEDCEKWEYDHEFYKSTIISEWDLVCKREELSSLTQSAYMFGVMVTVVVMGQLSDKFGRRPIILTGLVIEILAGFSCAFSVSVTHFIISRFALAYGASARWGTGFVLILETVGPEYRAVIGMAIEFGWALGYIILPGVAYLLRDFRWLQLAVTIPECVLLLWWCVLPESPRWQLTHGKFSEAKVAIRKAAITNRKSTENINIKLNKLMEVALADSNEDVKNRKANILDLLRTSIMLKNTLILFFSWFVNAFVYYGLSLNTNNLGGDPFINFLIAGSVEFPAYALCIYMLRKFGRRLLLTSAMFGGGLSCLLTIPFLSGTYSWIGVTFAMIGKFCVTCSFGMIYVYSAEVYPTVVRNVGVGSCSMVGRVGSILAPFVKELGKHTHRTVPLVIFGVLSIVDGFVILMLPETKGKEIPDTIDDAENFQSNLIN